MPNHTVVLTVLSFVCTAGFAPVSLAAPDCIEDDEYECVDVYEYEDDELIEDGPETFEVVAGIGIGIVLGAVLVGAAGAVLGGLSGTAIGGWVGVNYASSNGLTWGGQAIFGAIVMVMAAVGGAIIGVAAGGVAGLGAGGGTGGVLGYFAVAAPE